MTTHKYLVGVYGTLKKGFGNHRLLVNSEFIGNSTINGELYSNGMFPSFITNDKISENDLIGIELYLVDYDTLLNLDRLESVPYLYKHKKVKVMLPNGKYEQALIYERNQAHFNKKFETRLKPNDNETIVSFQK